MSKNKPRFILGGVYQRTDNHKEQYLAIMENTQRFLALDCMHTQHGDFRDYLKDIENGKIVYIGQLSEIITNLGNRSEVYPFGIRNFKDVFK